MPSAEETIRKTRPRAKSPLVRILIEFGPLLVFFLANSRFGIFKATAAFMVAIVISLGFSWRLERRLPPMALVTGAFVLVFGSLTLILADELFIKLKPTIVNLLFAAILVVGRALGRSPLKVLLGETLRLTDDGWNALTTRWALFFVLLAVLNEIVWRSFSTDTWVTFKVFGILPLTIVFSASLIPLLQRHLVEEEPEASDS